MYGRLENPFYFIIKSNIIISADNSQSNQSNPQVPPDKKQKNEIFLSLLQLDTYTFDDDFYSLFFASNVQVALIMGDVFRHQAGSTRPEIRILKHETN